MLRILFYGLFIGLVASQSLMDLFSGLIFICLFFLLYREKSREVYKPYLKWFWFTIPWFLYLLISFLLKSTHPQFIYDVANEFIWLPLFPLLVYLWKKISPDKSMVQILGIIMIIASFYAILVYILGFDPIQGSSSDRSKNLLGLWRTGGFFSNPMALAQSYGPLLMILLPISIQSLWSKDLNQKLNLILIVAFVLTFFAVLFTFTRGVWLSLFVSGILGGFLFNRRLGFMAILIAVLGSLILFFAWPQFKDRVLQTFDSKTSYDSERMVLWKTNWFIFQENPIFGIGYGENKRRLREYYNHLNIPKNQFEGHAHNQYLHFLSGTGLIGFLFYILWCFFFLKINYRLFNLERLNSSSCKVHSSLLLGLLLSQIAFHIGAITEANFSIAKNRLLLVLIWALIACLYQSSREIEMSKKLA